MVESAQNDGLVVPQQARSRHTRDRIFQVACTVFAAKGYDGARVETIARKAHVNKQRIYAYFGSKRDLYRRVLIDVYGQAASDGALLALGEADIPQMTDIVLDSFFEIHEKRPLFQRLLSWENLAGGNTLSAEDWSQIRNRYIRHIEHLFILGQERGVFRADVSFTAYLFLLFSTSFFYSSNRTTLSRLLGMELDRADIRHQMEAEILLVLDAGVRPRG